MKKLFFIAILSLLFLGGTNLALSHSIQEEAQGKMIWQKLQSKESNCDKLLQDDFHNLGEYFMDLMMGESHEAMNKTMVQMMGEEGEEQMHIAMGKRMSGCGGAAAEFPQGGWTSMMRGMGGGMMGNFGWGPMGFGFGFFGWMTMILLWVWIILGILGIIALIKWLNT